MNASVAAPSEKAAKVATESIVWMAADKDYSLGVSEGKLVCQNPKGKKLASVPKWLKESELAEQLLAMCEWVADHENDCLRRVETWMLRSLPIPRDVIARVWPDPGWSNVLLNLVVFPSDAKGKSDETKTGLLRVVDAKQGIGVVDRDGETQWIKAAQIQIPHPILIDGLNDLREIAADMSFTQSVEQLFRPVFPIQDLHRELTAINDFSDGKFEQLNYCTGHCKRLGYPVRGGYACRQVWENATPIEARYWVGDEYPESETYTGALIFVDENQMPLKMSDVGPVTFSEGMRMASEIYAKRVIEKEDDAS